MGRRPLVHIGYHKTASSWLQRRHFADSTRWSRLPRREIARSVINCYGLDFDADRARSDFKDWLAGASAASTVPVLSHERLSGYPHSGGYDSKELAGRIAAVLPSARILIVIRDQSEMVLSNYRQYVVDGGACSLNRYLHPSREGHWRVPTFSVAHFEYDRLVACYMALFDPQDVLVLPYELFRADPAEFLDQIDRLVGLPPEAAPATDTSEKVNLGRSPLSIEALRAVNRLFHRNDLNPNPLFDAAGLASRCRRIVEGVDRRLPPPLRRLLQGRQRTAVAKEIDGHYGPSNARTSELTGLALRDLGYPE